MVRLLGLSPAWVLTTNAVAIDAFTTVSPTITVGARCLSSWSHQIFDTRRLQKEFQPVLSATHGDTTSEKGRPRAVLVDGTSLSKEEERDMLSALEMAGYDIRAGSDDKAEAGVCGVYRYTLSRATGMLKLVSAPAVDDDSFNAPRWVPMVRGEENVLVSNGWSFLDPDESEPISSFDIDAANDEGLYRPQWGDTQTNGGEADETLRHVSSLGYDITQLSAEEVMAESETLLPTSEYSRAVLLDGKTDPRDIKMTSNGYSFSGSTGQSDILRGVFTCAIGGLPLFSSVDLAPTTASSGWLSFIRPIAEDHVDLVQPGETAMDRRIEVVCARSKCHLGHYFGKGEGYCINASALRFIPVPMEHQTSEGQKSSEEIILSPGSIPFSWHKLETESELSPTERVLSSALQSFGHFETVVLGAGCFWHVELALRRIPGVVTTEVGYAGGSTTSPTYKQVCDGKTGHAEAVKVTFDPDVCPPAVLFDCFLAMHDPTKVRAHGKHAKDVGQYRSCIFVTNRKLEDVCLGSMLQCRDQLGKDLSTDARLVKNGSSATVDRWFWRAEERHQRHDERLMQKDGTDKVSTLPMTKWLQEYGRRRASVIGSADTVPVGMDDPNDDGMARMMI